MPSIRAYWIRIEAKVRSQDQGRLPKDQDLQPRDLGRLPKDQDLQPKDLGLTKNLRAPVSTRVKIYEREHGQSKPRNVASTLTPENVGDRGSICSDRNHRP
jgi:hypothetical protein